MKKTTGSDLIHTSDGLTKREYFVAMAMQGMLAHYGIQDKISTIKQSVYCADELIKALNAEA